MAINPNKSEEPINYPAAIHQLILNVKLLNLLLLEHEIFLLVFPVPQSVQKIKTTKFHKSKGIVEQKSELLNYIRT